MTNATATKTTRKPTDPVAARIAELRKKAQTDPIAARDETWSWFLNASERLKTDQANALAELGTLFASGSAPTQIDGETEGLLVGWAANRVINGAMGAMTDRWVPWAGKRFDAAQCTGDDVRPHSPRYLKAGLWPRYKTRPHGNQPLIAFDFVTRA